MGWDRIEKLVGEIFKYVFVHAGMEVKPCNRNDEIAPATVTAIRRRDWHDAVEKVEENS